MKDNTPALKRYNAYDSVFLEDVLDGLAQGQKSLPCKYFYDERGSELFTKICELQEYYLTRTEMDLLLQVREDIALKVGTQVQIIEPGSGAGEKIKLLLEMFDAPRSVTLIDISAEILHDSVQSMRERFPDLSVKAVIGDFTCLHQLELGHDEELHNNPLLYFPGSTIGNFSPIEASALLSSFAKGLGHRGGLLIGVDQVKCAHVLERAYNDQDQVTSEFNKNLLRRINRELDADFDLTCFSHDAFYNQEQARIEMHLVSEVDQTVSVAGEQFQFTQGETIHTENSYKYTIESFTKLAKAAGWQSQAYWTDPEQKFAIHYMRFCD